MSHSTGVVADPNMDNSVYGDEYADYGDYEEGADASYDDSMMAGGATADGNKGDAATYLQPSTDGSWLCILCGKQSSRLANGKRHVNFAHMKASEEVECPVCHKMFGRKQVMDRHMKTIHSDHFIMNHTAN